MNLIPTKYQLKITLHGSLYTKTNDTEKEKFLKKAWLSYNGSVCLLSAMQHST